MKCYLIYVEVEDTLRWLEDPTFVSDTPDAEANNEWNREWNWSLSVNLLRFC